MNCDPKFLKQILRDYLYKTKDDWNYITPVAFYNDYFKKNNDYFLIDLRHPEDFKKFHIAGAHNMFWLNILDEENLRRIPKNKPVFLICYVGHTSSQTMTLLKLLDYKVISIKFGYGISPIKNVEIAGWIDYNFPVVN